MFYLRFSVIVCFHKSRNAPTAKYSCRECCALTRAYTTTVTRSTHYARYSNCHSPSISRTSKYTLHYVRCICLARRVYLAFPFNLQTTLFKIPDHDVSTSLQTDMNVALYRFPNNLMSNCAVPQVHIRR